MGTEGGGGNEKQKPDWYLNGSLRHYSVRMLFNLHHWKAPIHNPQHNLNHSSFTNTPNRVSQFLTVSDDAFSLLGIIAHYVLKRML